MSGNDRHDNGVAPSPPSPNQIIAQSAWNESAEQEKQFDISFVGVGVTTSDSVAIKTNWSKTVS